LFIPTGSKIYTRTEGYSLLTVVEIVYPAGSESYTKTEGHPLLTVVEVVHPHWK
jgi:hypothetical protein